MTESAPTFAEMFGAPPAFSASAPGRVNLLGEHTDYNDGFVLPSAIPQRTQAEVLPRKDGTVRVCSTSLSRDHGGHTVHTYTLGQEARGRGFLDYIQGVTQALRKHGAALSGFDLRLSSDIPLGSGLSSSAALEIALLRALREAFALPLTDTDLARLGQRAENDLVGVPVGILDQMACSLCARDEALFLDTRRLVVARLPLPADVELIVLHSGLTHSLAHGDYRTRRAECEQAAARLGVPALRDLRPADLPRIEALPAPLSQRARHVVTENERVLEAVVALCRGDAKRLGALFYESHRSMQHDFAVSLPQIDHLVDLAQADGDILGARLTGGGFGGSVVMLARRGTAPAAARRLARAYAQQTAQKPLVLIPEVPEIGSPS